ncbi:calcium-binding protein [Pseudoroseicyclus tamaricis]|uniref:Hemolysin type calcium-binding protein n=1 Tax=Pseudoroseicyclus tamaricis TaxID=2705421 RepID=A0A6B2JT89_9RHOB|nr:hypothetical protein [Pseudoroseicyclus tamaricis]NDV01250.1 hypothetical protein [Pseudoroseicyclus tamaricis]
MLNVTTSSGQEPHCHEANLNTKSTSGISASFHSESRDSDVCSVIQHLEEIPRDFDNSRLKFSVDRQWAEASASINASHFGVNFVYDFERIGDQPWEKFDEIVESLNSGTIRYPGGIAAETSLSLQDPDQAHYITSDGQRQEVMPLTEFLQHCKAAGWKASVVIPTAETLTENKIEGHRDFDVAAENDVYNFVMQALEAGGPRVISRFEIGNEYETHMSAVEYGRVASAIAEIAQRAIDDYAQQSDSLSWTEPKIAIQVWTESANEGTSLATLSEKNQKVMAEFNASEAAAVDAVVSHYYYDAGSHDGQVNEHAYENIDSIIGWSVDQMRLWEENPKFNDNLDIIFSEWNVNHKNVDTHGLQQLPVMLKMFATFVSEGVDQLDFWSAQYKPVSLAASGAQLTPAGEMFKFLSGLTRGTVLSTGPKVDNCETYVFSSPDRFLFATSSLSETVQVVRVSVPARISSDSHVIIVGVDEATSDGTYNGRPVDDYWAEADVAADVRKFSAASLISGGVIEVTLQPYEVMFLYDGSGAPLPPNQENGSDHFGAEGSEALTGDTTDEFLFGGAGNNIIFNDGGSDVVQGGQGADYFVVDPATHYLRIEDFDPGVDKLDLSQLLERAETLTAISEGGYFVATVCESSAEGFGSLTITAEKKNDCLTLDLRNDGVVFAQIDLPEYHAQDWIADLWI